MKLFPTLFIFIFIFIFIFQVQALGAIRCDQVLLKDSAVQGPLQGATERVISQLKEHTNQGLSPFQNDIIGFTEALQQIAKRDPVMAKILKMFQTKQYTFAMDRSAQSRGVILNTNEFLNIYQARKSDGAYNPAQRSQVEAEYAGLSLEEYKQLPDAIKPKSLYLVPGTTTGIDLAPTVYIQDYKTKEYAGDTWIFALDKIEQNTAFIVGDSYNRALIEREFADDFKQMNILPGAHFLKNNIMDYALPIDLLQTAVPFYYEQVRTENKFRFVNEDSAEYQKRFEDFKAEMDGMLADWQFNLINDLRPKFNDNFFRKFPELKPYEKSFLFRPYGNYVEGLYYGSLPVAGKVKAFIFRSIAPTAEEMAKFKAWGIQVIDGRQKK